MNLNKNKGHFANSFQCKFSRQNLVAHGFTARIFFLVKLTKLKLFRSFSQIFLHAVKRRNVCLQKAKSGHMKIRYCFTLLRSLRVFKASPLSGFCQQRTISKMAGEGDFKDFGPLVGAIDQGTSSSRFLVSSKLIYERNCTEFRRLAALFLR